MLFYPHDVLQAETPPHEETEGANIQCQPGTAAPTPQGFPEWANSADCVCVRNSQHGAAESLNAYPWIVVASTNAVFEVVHTGLWSTPHSLIQCARAHNRCGDCAEVEAPKEYLNEQCYCELHHGAPETFDDLRPDRVPLGAFKRT